MLLLGMLVEQVELLQADTGPARIRSHFIQCAQPVVAIEHGILHALRHHRAGELLEAHGELRLKLSLRIQAQYVANKIK